MILQLKEPSFADEKANEVRHQVALVDMYRHLRGRSPTSQFQ